MGKVLWEVQVWERGRWCVDTIHPSISVAAARRDALRATGEQARIVQHEELSNGPIPAARSRIG